jgi:hypothetical protein
VQLERRGERLNHPDREQIRCPREGQAERAIAQRQAARQTSEAQREADTVEHRVRAGGDRGRVLELAEASKHVRDRQREADERSQKPLEPDVLRRNLDRQRSGRECGLRRRDEAFLNRPGQVVEFYRFHLLAGCSMRGFEPAGSCCARLNVMHGALANF